jgi:xanthine dehydrogenase iron-sulfur cluster and FAD-binding subunit A
MTTDREPKIVGRSSLVRNTGGSEMAITLVVNDIPHTVDVEPDTPLLWVLRDSLKLTGTKYGCGIAQCGACTVLIDGRATRSCSMPVSLVAGKSITTIEGLSADGTHPVQLALYRVRRPPVRILPVRADHGRGCPAQG